MAETNKRLVSASQICKCTVFLLKDYMDTNNNDHQCITCGASVVFETNKGARVAPVVLLVKCRIKHARVHKVGFVVCSRECMKIEQTERKMQKIGTDIPGSVLSPWEAANRAAASVVRVHPFSGSICEGCSFKHLQNTPDFMVCGKCRKSQYCSSTCQAADWKKNHQPLCRFRRGKSSPGDRKSALETIKHLLFKTSCVQTFDTTGSFACEDGGSEHCDFFQIDIDDVD